MPQKSLVSEVRAVLQRLAPAGWHDLLCEHGLNIKARDLDAELHKSLPKIRRSMEGFEDFAIEGHRGIEPRSPARSLLYHALASPRVTGSRYKLDLRVYPTLAELDIIENYVFGVQRPSLGSIRRLVGKDALLAVATFAYEYRPASQTCHKRHADLVFSRTGVSRVGTHPERYEGRLRGFIPYVDDDPTGIRVSPARYGAFIAARVRGATETFCPMRFRSRPDASQNRSDAERMFWVPVHKLFPGDECITGLDLSVDFEAYHVNEKLRRIHLALQERFTQGGRKRRSVKPRRAGNGFDTGWSGADLDQPPFVVVDDIAGLSRPRPGRRSYSPGVLTPEPHPLVTAAKTADGSPIAFWLPCEKNLLFSTFEIASTELEGDLFVRNAPEYVHVRTQIDRHGKAHNLNEKPNVSDWIGTHVYRAQHYIDYTADGWVAAVCPELSLPRRGWVESPLPAYSIVTAPDFFYRCDQREVMEWTESLPKATRATLWPEADPAPLSDQRFPANLQLYPASPFVASDDTITAVVPLFGRMKAAQTSAPPFEDVRHSHLPDDSAGVFAPGWDVSLDRWRRTLHLAAYGLGSPFPEDMKLCAALSNFWPAAAPDVSREFAYGPLSGAPTVFPLTDEEIGFVGNLSWDGTTPVRPRQTSGSPRFMQFRSFEHVDYTLNALHQLFTFRVTSRIDLEEFQSRVIAMALVYRVLGARREGEKSDWIVYSFRHLAAGDPILERAETEAAVALISPQYRFEMIRFREKGEPRASSRPRGRPTIERLRVRETRVALVDPENLHILEQRGATWISRRPPVL